MARRKITNVEEADKAMEGLGWLKFQGSPNKDVRDLWQCAVTYRSALRQEMEKGDPTGEWQSRVKK